MAIIKRTVLDQIEITRHNAIQVRLSLEVFDEENDEVLSSSFHRTVLHTHTDADAQIGEVNAHLAQMGKDILSQADVDKLKRYQEFVKQQ